MTSSTALVHRDGPVVEDYVVDFLFFLNERTGFRSEHFCCTNELTNTLKNLEFHKVPRNLWQAFLNVATKLIASCSTENLTVENFVTILMQIITTVINFAMDYFFLKATLHIISILTPPLLKVVIIALYHFFTWTGRKVWERAYPNIESYSVFVLKQLRSKSELEITEPTETRLQIKEE